MLHAHIVIDVIAAMEANSSAASNFSVQTFIHFNKPPSVVSINSAYELSDVSINAKLSQFGPKGMCSIIINRHVYTVQYNNYAKQKHPGSKKVQGQ